MFWIFKLILILGCCKDSLSFNVDTKNPVIITNNFNNGNSFFGTTVSLFKKKNEDSTSASSWVIIGAPKANSGKHPSIEEPGVIWRCSLGKISGDYCNILEMDNHGNEMQHHHAPGEGVHNRKDGSWLGGSISIGTDRMVSCAPRWSNQRANNITQTSHYLMNGLCYWRPKEQIVQDFTIPTPPINNTLIPLRNKDRQGFRGKRGFDWTFGQAGFSVHIPTDELETIIGAPGVFDWKGTVIRLKDSTEPVLRRNGLPEYFGTFYQAPQVVVKPELESLWTQNNTYFGYDVNSGKFIDSSDTSVQYVSSAPRGGFQNNLTGHVLIFTFSDSEDEPLRILSQIEGPTELGTYFGSVLCSVDLNQDGFSDLLVGAPLLSKKRMSKIDEIGSSSIPSPLTAYSDFTGHGDEGGVFIYMSERTRMVPAPARFVSGNNAAWARFGSSIASIGDINKDGFFDVAIGAPYQDSRRGVIYIYHGTANGLHKNFAQIIYAKDLNENLKGFGYSISPGIDIDGNGYKDFAVGAYISAQTVILRTKPVIKVNGHLESSHSKIPINKKDFTFSFKSCVDYESKDSISQLVFNIKLISDVDSKTTRVFIEDSTISASKEFSYEVRLTLGEIHCREFKGIVKQSLTLSGHPIVIRQEIFLVEPQGIVLGSTNYTILPAGFGLPRLENAGIPYNSFCKNCPVTQEEKANTSITLFPIVPCGDDNVCIADLEIKAEFTNHSSGAPFVIGSSSTLNFTIVLLNKGETAIRPTLSVNWSPRSLHNTPSGCSHSNSFELFCELGQTLEKNQKKTVTLEFDMSDLMGGEQNIPHLFVFINANTTSNLANPLNQSTLVLPIKTQAKLTVITTKTKMNLTSLNPYDVFTHPYLIKLDGPSPLKRVEIQFDIPESIAKLSGKYQIVDIIYFQAKQDGVPIKCNGPNHLSYLFSARDPDFDGLLDDNKLEVSDQSSGSIRNLRKREANIGKGIKRKNTLVLDCSSSVDVVCVQIICLVESFIPNTRSTFDLTFRISTNETRALMEEFGVNKIEFKTRGRATMINVDSSVDEKMDVNESVIIIEIETPPVSTFVWVASSVFAGIFIIICIALILYCCGVFDRKKIQESEQSPSPEAVPLHNFEPETTEAGESPVSNFSKKDDN